MLVYASKEMGISAIPLVLQTLIALCSNGRVVKETLDYGLFSLLLLFECLFSVSVYGYCTQVGVCDREALNWPMKATTSFNLPLMLFDQCNMADVIFEMLCCYECSC